MKSFSHSIFVSALVAVFIFCTNAPGDEINIAPDGVTDFFGNGNGVADEADAAGLLFDEARTGGGDTATQNSFTPSRFLEPNAGTNSNWAAGLVPGAPATITVDGMGFALRGGTTATIMSVTVIYLGADGAVGTADDEIVGIATDDLNYSSVNEYAWRFSAPMKFEWDGLNNRFRFEMTGIDGALRFKQRPTNESPSGQGGLTISVAGSMASEVLLGDVNLDGAVNLLDVDPFVELVSTGVFQAEADINEDGFVDLLDVQPFVDLLSNN